MHGHYEGRDCALLRHSFIYTLLDTEFKWRATRATVHGADLFEVPVMPASGPKEQAYDWKQIQAKMMTCQITMIPSRWLAGWLPFTRSLSPTCQMLR